MASGLRSGPVRANGSGVLLAGALMLAACAPLDAGDDIRSWKSALLRDHPLVGRIWLPDEARFIPPHGLLDRLSTRKFVLLGERHDNADHHRIQAWITGRLIVRGRRPALVMEMFRARQQAEIDAYLAAHPGDSPGLGKATGWGGSGWPDWRHYEPIVRPVVAKGLPLIAANLSRDKLRRIVKGGFGSLAPERLRALNLDRPIKAPMLAAMDREIVEAHCGLLDAGRARPFTRIQLLRDARFAEALRRGAARSQGAVLITGSGHARRDRGVPLHLQRAGIEPRAIFALGIVEVAEDVNTPVSYGAVYGVERPPFDAVWFTPRKARKDPCEKFKASRKKNELDCKEEVMNEPGQVPCRGRERGPAPA